MAWALLALCVLVIALALRLWQIEDRLDRLEIRVGDAERGVGY